MRSLLTSLLDSVLVRSPLFQRVIVMMNESARALELLRHHNMQLQELSTQALFLSEIQNGEADDIKVALTKGEEAQEQIVAMIKSLASKRDEFNALPRLFEKPAKRTEAN